MGTGILIGLAIEFGIAAEIGSRMLGFGWMERAALWIVVIANVIA